MNLIWQWRIWRIARGLPAWQQRQIELLQTIARLESPSVALQDKLVDAAPEEDLDQVVGQRLKASRDRRQA